MICDGCLEEFKAKSEYQFFCSAKCLKVFLKSEQGKVSQSKQKR